MAAVVADSQAAIGQFPARYRRGAIHLWRVLWETQKEKLWNSSNNCRINRASRIQYHLYVREKVEGGLRDLKKRRTVGQKEVERRMESG